MGVRGLKCGLIGCGEVGVELLRLLVRSPICTEIAVVDAKRADKAVQHITSAFPFLPPVNVYAGDYCDLADAHLTVITEADDFESTVSRLCRVVGNSTLLIAAEPCDALVTAAHVRFGYPHERLLGIGTFIDTARLEALISNHLGVSRGDVRAPLLGGRGEFSICPWEYATVGGIPLFRYFDLCGGGYDKNMPQEFLSEIRRGGGYSSYTLALAAFEICSSLFFGGDRIITVSTPARGAYGIEGAALSLPCTVGAGVIRRVLEIRLNGNEEEKLCRYATKLLG